MDFKKTIDEVNLFYADFDRTITTVNGLFDSIDDNGGREKENELTKIVELLEAFWGRYSQNISDKVDIATEGNSPSFLSKLHKKTFEDNELLSLCKDIQLYFRNLSVAEVKPSVHIEANPIINKLFLIVNNTEEKEQMFSLVRTIYELVADNLLIKCGISKLYYWNYGTDAFSLLAAEQQLLVLLNQSIMLDRLHSGQSMLKLYLSRLNKHLDGFTCLDWFVYYVAGFLNFKVHNYRESNKFFSIVEKENLLQTSNMLIRKRYFHAVLLIAYGYEYAGDFSKAIEKIVMPVDRLCEIIKAVEIKDIRNESVLLDILNNLIHNSLEDSLFKKFFAGHTITSYISDYSLRDQYNMHVEILHALAHCLNEYAIQNNSSCSDDCAKLIYLARELMALIAREVKEYWTCYATIHGEFKDYDLALEELCKASERIQQKENTIKESLAAEIAFYQYYFGQIIHKQIDNEKEIFANYCMKYSDDDALCHLQIFEFRELLREYVSKLFEHLTKYSRKKGKVEDLPPIDTIRHSYIEICQLHPSLHMNVNIRAELRLMQRIYVIIERLNNYLTNVNSYNLKMLLNSCKRFCYTKKELGLSDEVLIPSCETNSSILPKEVHRTLFGVHGVVHCLNTTDSVFLLAPISGVVVYQYQTGTIDKLFDITALLGNKKLVTPSPISHLDTKQIITAFRKVVSRDKQVHITFADMDAFMQKGIINIYLWSSDVPAQLLQVSEKGSYVRRLTNEKLFRNVIERSFTEAEYDAVPCIKSDFSYCKIYTVNLPWLEVINEDDSESTFVLHKRSIDGREEYLILAGDIEAINDQFCDIHRLLEPIKVQQIFSQDTSKLPSGEGPTNNQTAPLKQRIIKEYAEFIKIRKDYDAKSNFLSQYSDSIYKNAVNKLKEDMSKKGELIEMLIKELYTLLPHQEYIKFIKKEIRTGDYILFGIRI